jgi:nicotinate-nucleotide adenylyltransferase
VARAAADQFHLDQVLFVPASRPPHKTAAQGASYADRLRMVELACEADPRFRASDLEQGAEVSYSILTIEKLLASGASGPHETLFFLIGSDAFAEIRTWHRWRDVVNAVGFIVVKRPGGVYDIPPGARVHELAGINLPVSSSEIRRQLAAGIMPSDLPRRVAAYVADRHLYGFHAAGR